MKAFKSFFLAFLLLGFGSVALAQTVKSPEQPAEEKTDQYHELIKYDQQHEIDAEDPNGRALFTDATLILSANTELPPLTESEQEEEINLANMRIFDLNGLFADTGIEPNSVDDLGPVEFLSSSEGESGSFGVSVGGSCGPTSY